MKREQDITERGREKDVARLRRREIERERDIKRDRERDKETDRLSQFVIQFFHNRFSRFFLQSYFAHTWRILLVNVSSSQITMFHKLFPQLHNVFVDFVTFFIIFYTSITLLWFWPVFVRVSLMGKVNLGPCTNLVENQAYSKFKRNASVISVRYFLLWFTSVGVHVCIDLHQ